MQAVNPAGTAWQVTRVWVTEVDTPRQAMVRIGPLSGQPGWIAQRLGRGWNGSWIADCERSATLAAESWMRRRGGSDAWTELERPSS
ncbi:hypothetical protein GCM10010172_06890 [Paractinoplanes ferrugineus]|uniref:Uncharacterized protein n=1 Tax=Paractinoplanes ferrugineus TaxID=113564 RepID=A0A919J8W6_9ACTN|nr:hypothetical protein [Actinoplanes ferrugineus]GIE16283.1 hypothetical protein Afe05nite_81230 [Actinoplanes ferrugineus]